MAVTLEVTVLNKPTTEVFEVSSDTLQSAHKAARAIAARCYPYSRIVSIKVK